MCLVSGQQHSESSGESIVVPSVTDIANNEAVSHTEGDECPSNLNLTENIQQHNSRSELNMRFMVQTPNAPQNVSYRDAIPPTDTPNDRNDTGSIITTLITRNTDSAAHNSGYYFWGSCEVNENDDHDDFVQFFKKEIKTVLLRGVRPDLGSHLE